MANKIKLEITQAQLNAIINLRDDADSSVGGTDVDQYLLHNVRLVDRMLKANGHKSKIKSTLED